MSDLKPFLKNIVTAETVTNKKEFLKFVKNVNIKFFFLANTKKLKLNLYCKISL